MPEWSSLLRRSPLRSSGEDLWLQPQQQAANCLKCNATLAAQTETQSLVKVSWSDPAFLWTMWRWIMNGYFGSITNTVIYIHDWLIPQRASGRGTEKSSLIFQSVNWVKNYFKNHSLWGPETREVGLFIMIICFLTKPWIWKVERRAA